MTNPLITHQDALEVCLCGALKGNSHHETCPFPLFDTTSEEQVTRWCLAHALKAAFLYSMFGEDASAFVQLEKARLYAVKLKALTNK